MTVPWADVIWARTWWGVRSMLVEYEPRISIPRHVHPDAHVYVLTRGSYSATADGTMPRACHPGAIVVRPAHSLHWDEIGPAGCTDARLELPPVCNRWLPPEPAGCLCDTLAARATALSEYLSQAKDGGPEAYVELFGFLWSLRRQMLEGQDRAWMTSLLDLLSSAAECNDARMTPDRAAERAGVSRSTLQKWAAQRCGVTVGRLLRQARALAAARRIVRSFEPLAAIAIDAGYCDQPHLTRELRSWLGVTPAQLRHRPRP